MTRFAAVILALAVASTGGAASAQACLGVLGCAASSTGTSTDTSPGLVVGATPGMPAAVPESALSSGGAALLYDSLGNLRVIPGAAQSDPNPVAPSALDPASAPDPVTKSPSLSPTGPRAASEPGVLRLQAIPQGPD